METTVILSLEVDHRDIYHAQFRFLAKIAYQKSNVFFSFVSSFNWA